MKTICAIIAVALCVSPALAKQEQFWIEKVALMATHQGVCGEPQSDEAMQTAIGAAMIELAINKKTVIERARKRAHAIADYIAESDTQHAFCEAFMYYLENGYPK